MPAAIVQSVRKAARNWIANVATASGSGRLIAPPTPLPMAPATPPLLEAAPLRALGATGWLGTWLITGDPVVVAAGRPPCSCRSGLPGARDDSGTDADAHA